MKTEAPVSVQEYLQTTYRPDCDYIDGSLEDRNVGRRRHARAQKKLLLYLAGRKQELNIHAIQEQRVQIGPARFRVICVMLRPESEEEVITTPPFLCIEILSPDDRMLRMQTKIEDYPGFGVRFVWIVDPYANRGWISTAGGMRPVHDGMLRTSDPELAVPLSAIFD